MSLVLTGITAYEFWRSAISHDAPEFGEVSKQSYFALFKHEFARALSTRLSHSTGIPGDLHLLASSASERRNAKGIVFHYLSHVEDLPSGSFYQISRSVFCVSPELCFVQLASSLPFLELVRAGIDLCSRYSISLFDRMVLVECEQATTRERLERYVEKLPKGFRGAKHAKAAIRYIHDGSRSPRETSLCILMALSTRRGGFQMPPFELNHRIDLDDKEALLTRKQWLEGDVYFLGMNRVFEYESDEFHNSESQLSFDLEKISTLQIKGLTVTPISTWQMNNFDALESLMIESKRQMGFRERSADELSQERRYVHFQVLEKEKADRQSSPLADTKRWKCLMTYL